jgi:hypothetical protein
MTAEQIRLEALKLAIPQGISNPDTKLILDRAREYETFIVGEVTQPPRAKRTSGKTAAELPMGAQPQEHGPA